jgi:hypothetical protein
MPISSVVISQLIGQQQQQQIVQGQMANQMSMQNPLARLEASQVGPDRFSQRAVGASTGVANFGESALGGITAGASLGAAFGFAPSVLDPFTGTFKAAGSAFRGAGGLAGHGLSSGLGAGAMAAGAYMAVGAAANFATQNIMQGVQQQTHMAGMFQNTWGASGIRMNSSLGNVGAMSQAALSMSDQASAGISGIVNPGSMTNLVGIGMASGRFKGVQSVEQFKGKLSEYTAEAAQMAKMLKVSIDEAAQQMEQISGGLGISTGGAVGMVGQMASMVSSTGLGFNQQMGMAQSGMSTFQGMGLSRASGSVYGLGMGQRIGTGLMGGALNQRAIADFGGASAFANKATSGGLRGLSGRHGNRILGAIMGEDGYDEEMASRIASGMASQKEIMKAYKANVKGRDGRQMLAGNREELMGKFMGDFGPEGVVGGLSAMNRGKGDSNFLLRQATGMSTREVDQLQQLAAAGPAIRMKMAEAAREGFNIGTNKRSITELVSLATEQLVGPIKKHFNQIGRNISQGITESVDEIQRGILGLPGNTGIPKTGLFQAEQALRSSGRGQTADNMYGVFKNPILSDGTRVTPAMAGLTGGGQSFSSQFGQGVRDNLMPSALEHLQQGGNVHDLGLGAFLPPALSGAPGSAIAGVALADMGIGRAAAHSQHFFDVMETSTGAAKSTYLRGAAANLSPSARLGRGLGSVATHIGSSSGAKAVMASRGLLGFEGVSVAGGSLKATQLGLRAGGLGMRALGGAGRLFGPMGIVASELAIQTPAMMQSQGLTGADIGYSGRQAEAMAGLYAGGYRGAGITSSSSKTVNESLLSSGYEPVVGGISGGLQGSGNSMWDMFGGFAGYQGQEAEGAGVVGAILGTLAGGPLGGYVGSRAAYSSVAKSKAGGPGRYYNSATVSQVYTNQAGKEGLRDFALGASGSIRKKLGIDATEYSALLKSTGLEFEQEQKRRLDEELGMLSNDVEVRSRRRTDIVRHAAGNVGIDTSMLTDNEVLFLGGESGALPDQKKRFDTAKTGDYDGVSKMTQVEFREHMAERGSRARASVLSGTKGQKGYRETADFIIKKAGGGSGSRKSPYEINFSALRDSWDSHFGSRDDFEDVYDIAAKEANDYVQGLSGTPDGLRKLAMGENLEKVNTEIQKRVISKLGKDQDRIDAAKDIFGRKEFGNILLRDAAKIAGFKERSEQEEEFVRKQKEIASDYKTKSEMFGTFADRLDGVVGGRALAEKMEAWIEAKGEGQTDLANSIMTEITAANSKMDMGDRQQVAEKMQGFFGQTGNLGVGELSMKTRGPAVFATATSDYYKNTKSFTNRLKIASTAFGGGEAEKILGLKGGTAKERAAIRKQIKDGGLDVYQRRALEKDMTSKLVGQFAEYGDAQQAARHMVSQMPKMVDAESLTGDEEAADPVLRDTLAKLQGSKARKGDSANAQQATAFTKNLGRMNVAMQKFIDNLPTHKNVPAGDGDGGDKETTGRKDNE